MPGLQIWGSLTSSAWSTTNDLDVGLVGSYHIACVKDEPEKNHRNHLSRNHIGEVHKSRECTVYKSEKNLTRSFKDTNDPFRESKRRALRLTTNLDEHLVLNRLFRGDGIAGGVSRERANTSWTSEEENSKIWYFTIGGRLLSPTHLVWVDWVM